MKPTFLVIGAAKAGTTTFWALLRQHPEVFLAARKELHFFSFERNWRRGTRWYESWFEEGAEHAQRGECSTTYAIRRVFPRAAERIAGYAPELKLIYLVRDPLERIESGWQQLMRFGPAPPIRAAGLGHVPDALWVSSSFTRSVREQADVLVESTNYWRELELYRRWFPRERVLVLLFEDLKREPREVLRRAFRFLEVDPDFELEDYDVHANPYGTHPVPRPFLRRLWADPLCRRLSAAVVDRLPPRLSQRFGRRFLRIPLVGRPAWDAETRSWVLERLRDDLERFLDVYGCRRDAWTLS